jgi:sulfonate transport system permease protein
VTTSAQVGLSPIAGWTERPPAAHRRLSWLLLPWLAPLALLALWQLITRAELVSAQVLVAPARVVATFVELLRSGELGAHLRGSLLRLGIGFAAGAGSGLLFGILMGVSRRVEVYSAPIFQAVRQVPSIALIPAFILIFGVEETFKIVLVSKACFFPVALAAFNGVKTIPRQYVEVAAVYQLPWLSRVRLLVLPATVPPIVAGVRISLGRAWVVLVAAELMAADQGIGQMMEMGRQMFRMDVVMVGVLVTGLIGLGLDGGVRLLERSFGKWRIAR